MPTVESPKGTRAVRNVGWLLRHAHEVTRIEITEEGHGEATLVASLLGERTYRCAFASFSIACDWVQRPRFAQVLCIIREANGHPRGHFYL